MAPSTFTCALAAATAALLLAGCGAGSSNPGVARLASGALSVGSASAASGADSASPEAAALAFADCMRSHGVPHFPDPTAGGGFLFHTGAGVDPSSPAFKEAQSKCKQFLQSPAFTRAAAGAFPLHRH
jgi:hypothetical protein